MLAVLKIFNLPSQENPSSLTLGLRLRNIGSSLPFRLGLIIGSELGILQGQHPSQRKEVILFWKFAPQAHQVEPKQILPGDDMDARIMVDLLEEMHLDKDIGINCEVCPIDVPISSLVAALNLPV